MTKSEAPASSRRGRHYDLYVDLLKKSLTDIFSVDCELANACPIEWLPGLAGFKRWKWYTRARLGRLLGLLPVRPDRRSVEERRHDRENGLDWPMHGVTMTGLKRLDALQDIVETVLDEGVLGDFIETGVWRGGSCIFMKALLQANGISDRRVWVCDSFEGLPPPDPAKHPADAGDVLYLQTMNEVSLEEVRANFEMYGVLDDSVHFVKGYFEETLADVPVERLALMRLDGDMYGSTITALETQYPKLEPGGFVIVDDFYSLDSCRAAVTDYRAKHGISDPITHIDRYAVWWRRGARH